MKNLQFSLNLISFQIIHHSKFNISKQSYIQASLESQSQSPGAMNLFTGNLVKIQVYENLLEDSLVKN